MDILNNIGQTALLVYIFMTLFFLVNIMRRKNDITDVAWGFGLIFVAIGTLVSVTEPSLRAVLVTTLVIIWGLRLSIHIYDRNRKGEDFRFQKLKEKWGKYFLFRSYFQLFMLQGLLLLIVSLPIIIINTTINSSSLGIIDLLGLFVWVLGFLFEAIGDYQLKQFKKDPNNKEKIMRKGLWYYTRHPNYFGELIQWWGIFIISISVPFWWLAILSPITVTILIFKIFGIPIIEKHYQNHPEFEEYKKQTSSFFPRIPRKIK